MSWTIVVGAALAAFFLASIVHQFRPAWWLKAARLDVLNLLPCWTFFAPNPGRRDFHVVYRDWAGDVSGAWEELVPAESNPAWRWIWNPARYPSKAVSDLTNALHMTQQAHRDHPRSVLLSETYISLLHWVMAQPAQTAVSHRQFALLETHGFGKDRRMEIRYVSEVHRAVS